MAKKDKTLRQCLDYRELNEKTINNCYLLLLMSMAFDLLQGAKIFTKVDRLVTIKEVDEWKTPLTCYLGSKSL